MHSSSAPAIGVSLRELFPQARFIGSADLRVTSCTSDSRVCRAGDLFVALDDGEFDGCDSAVHAMARGAKGVLSEQPLSDLPLTACIVPNVRAAYARLCQALAGDPAEQLQTIGIAGSYGKTVSSFLAAAVLEAGGRPSGVVGALGYFDGESVGPTSWATPDPAELARIMRQMVANGCQHAVLEASRLAVATDRLNGIPLDAVVVTSLAGEAVSNTRRLFNAMRPEGIAIFNLDDPGVAALAADYSGPAVTIGIDSAAELSAVPLEQCLSEQTFLLSVGDELSTPVRTSLIGRANIHNCLVAAALGEVYHIDPAAMVRGLEAVSVVPGRMERIECGQPFSVFVDRARRPAALAMAINTLRPLVNGRLIVVSGADSDTDGHTRSQLGRIADSGSDLLVITTNNPGYESPRDIASDMLAGVRRRDRSHVELDRDMAIAWALEHARTGDCVLIAGKGNEDYQLVEDEPLPHDDRQAARDWLYAQVAPTRASKAA
ncbi:MAG: UDP-N-acetylmuramyl-tripeptide synthetase [Pirellulales bacterium]|nr:UDP-N-acetylmuramyl-tripeptide synthetase [Pirellulales bacterium]